MATIKTTTKTTNRFIISKSLIGKNTILPSKIIKVMTVLIIMIKYIIL